jgi:serine/threonine protein kinase
MIGQTLNNRYKITNRIGKGAMGTVYRATDNQSGRIVAVKIIASDLSVDPTMLERFRREGETLRQLNHLNIVGFVDAFQHEESYAIIMEFVSGGSLFELLKSGPLPIDQAIQITLDLCDALIQAHRLRMVHRDIKPENVLIAEDGTIKLADFGVARLNEGTRMTRSGMQVGTPYYMAPEAWEGKTLDAQADIWSLGIVLFEMLAGQLPFAGDTPLSVMSKVNTQPPPDLRKLRADVPSDLVRIVSRMLTRRKDKRYQSMREVAVDLERIQQAAIRKPGRGPKPPREAPTIKIPDWITNWQKTIASFIKKVRWSRTSLAALVMILVLGAGAIFIWGRSGAPDVFYTINGIDGLEIRQIKDGENILVFGFGGSDEGWHPVPDSFGNLYFSSFSPTGQVEVFVRDADGNVAQFTHTPDPYYSWAPAPDNRGNLFFASNQDDGKTEIYVIEQDGIKTRITTTPDEFESWSPAPDRLGNLYFVSNQEDGKAEIYVLESDGTKRRVTRTPGEFESWSPAPDGLGNLYFASNVDGNTEIYVIDASGQKHQVTDSPEDVENWSPVPASSGALFFTSTRNDEIEILWMDSNGRVRVIEGIPRGSWLKEETGDPSTPDTTN